MSQTRTAEQTSTPTTARRVNFSDGNRALHLQAFFKWLPETLHDAPLINWTQLPSRTIGYLVNTVGDSPFAETLAIAAFTATAPLREPGLMHHVSSLNILLNELQTLCGLQNVAGLTSKIWEAYMAKKKLTPGSYNYFKAYTAFTESHLPDYLEQLNPSQSARIAPYLLPRLSRKFRYQHLQSRTVQVEEAKQRRKEKSDVIAPLHTLLVALVQFRKQNMQRLLSAYHEILAQTKESDRALPLFFSYEDELVVVNRDAQTVADVRLEKRSVTMRFKLWDRQSWVKKHPEDYQRSLKQYAKIGVEAFAQQQFFVECLNPAEDLLWFGDLIKYRLFRWNPPPNMTREDTHRRLLILRYLGTSHGLACSRDGVLTPSRDLIIALSLITTRTGALVFDAEALCRGAIFASALAMIALTNGSRMCELLQISADRFKARPYIVKSAKKATGEERVMHMQLLLPKGKYTEAERKLFPISDWSWEILCEIGKMLKDAHKGSIPVVRSHKYNSKAEDLPPERYLFQWDASPDGGSGAFSPEDVTSLLRFILYGLEFQTKEGEPFSVSSHLLRHVMATVARHEYAVPVKAVARVLHHEERTGIVPASTEYYSQETEELSWVAFADFQTSLEVRAASLLVEWPSAQEISGMDEDLRESFERWHTLLETTFGFCGNIDLCPRGYNRTLCIGSPHLNVDPRKRKNAEHWRDVYTQLAEELEACGNEVDARQYRLLVRDLEKHLKDMEFLQASIEDGARRPIFLLQPAIRCEGVIVDAEA